MLYNFIGFIVISLRCASYISLNAVSVIKEDFSYSSEKSDSLLSL